MNHEIEIKFSASGQDVLDRMAATDVLGGFTVVPVGIKPHEDIYFDTAALTLFHGCAVLRLRVKPSSSILTFKAQDDTVCDVRDPLHRRIEIERATDASPEDIAGGACDTLEPMTALRERFGVVALGVCMTACNERRVLHLAKDGNPLYEMALDDVIFKGPRGERRIFEIEVESMGGGDDDLRRIERILREEYGLTPAGPSKYIHGMELVGGV